MNRYIEKLKSYKDEGLLNNEGIMWKSIEDMDAMLNFYQEEHPEEYHNMVKNLHEKIKGEHFDKDYAEYEVSKMHHTDTERKDLTEYDEDGNLRNRLDVMKERLFLKDVRLRVDPKGLSYNEFRALINLEPYQKFSTIPSSTLELLRDKVLLALDNNLEWHIQKWTKLIKDIEKVAECREIKLK